MPSPYEVLGVAEDAPDFVIQAAYRACLKRYHPDGYNGSDARVRTEDVINAHRILNDPAKRLRLDQRLAQERARTEREQSHAGPDANAGSGRTRRAAPPRRQRRGWVAPVGLLAVVALLIVLAVRPGQEMPAAAEAAMLAAGMPQPTPPEPEPSAADREPVAALDPTLAPGLEQPEDGQQLWGTEEPVEFANIEDGAKRFLSVWSSGGLQGARAFSEECHKDAAADLQWSSLDYCAAFDLAANIMDSAGGRAFTRVPDPYFKFQTDFQADHYENRAATAFRRLDKIRTVANGIVAQEIQRQAVLAAAAERARADAAATALLQSQVAARTEWAAGGF